jgi:hypothetical protein
MAAVLDLKEEKWFRKATARFKELWAPAVKAAESFEAFCTGISAITGLPVEVVRASLPAGEWKKFQAEAEKYLPVALSKIEAAYRAKKWSTRYKRAFSRSS